MKENTKYHTYRFVGKFNIDEIQPWFDFTTSKPWDETEVPWILDNKVRREILIRLAEVSKSFDEIYNEINFSPKPLLISEEEHDCKVSFQWTKKTLENHLMNLEWYNLIDFKEGRYKLTIPIINMENALKMEQYIIKFTENWISIINQLKNEISEKLGEFDEKEPLYQVLVEKAIEKLYLLLKKENLISDEPDIKVLWAEQLRNIKFEKWVEKNF